MTPQTCAEAAAAPLAAATEQVLETMFFSAVDGRLDVVPESAADAIAAALPFRGEFCGLFRLDISLASARRVAASFLAAEPETLSPSRIAEVICELANMICGCALSSLSGDTVFELLSPHLESKPAPAGVCCAVSIFQLENGFIRVSLEVH